MKSELAGRRPAFQDFGRNLIQLLESRDLEKLVLYLGPQAMTLIFIDDQDGKLSLIGQVCFA
jgi:hypothetical protein